MTLDTEKATKNSKWKIDYHMLPYKIHFFTYFGAMSGLITYLTLFTKQKLALSSTAIGLMFTTQQFVIIFTKPMIGAIVDYTNRMKLVIIVLVVFQAVCYLLLLAVPSLVVNLSHANQNVYAWTLTMSNLHESDLHQVTCLTPVVNTTLGENGFLNFSDSNLLQISSSQSDLSNISDRNDSICVVQSNSSYHNAEDSVSDDWCFNINESKIIPDLPQCPTNKSLSYYAEIGRYLKHNDSCYIRSYSMNLTHPQWSTTIIVCESQMEGGHQTRQISFYETYQFWVFYFFLTAGGICINALFTLSDTACYEGLQKSGGDYGKQRLFGAVGWGVFAPLAGVFNDLATGNSEKADYSPGWYMMGVLSLFLILNISKVDLVKPKMSQSLLKHLGSLLKSPEFLVFGVATFFIGFFTGYIWIYLTIFMHDIGSSNLQIGLAQFSECFLGEIPFMYFSGWFVKKLGHFQVLTFSFLVFALRFGLYGILYNPWYIIPIEISHGLTYGVFYPALTAFAKMSSKPGTEATTQSILCCIYEGLGAGLGSLVAGIGFDRLGSHKTFYYSAIVCLGLSLCNFTATMILKRKRTKMLEVETPKSSHL